MIVVTMQRCFYLYESGSQCEEEAVVGSDFCPDHDEAHVFFEIGDRPVRKLVTRLVALILLIIFLIPFYYTLKTLYLSPPIEAQEGG